MQKKEQLTNTADKVQDLPSALIIDANILFSFFKKDSERRQIVEELLNHGIKLVSPYFILDELRAGRDKIVKFSKISIGEFELTIRLIEDEISLVPEDDFKEFFSKARELAPHEEDIPYFALALAFNSSLWSDEKAFRNQSEVKVLSTSKLSGLMR
ncbi:MAG: PIN domain-containing protein [Nanoarchaeota archaeon]|nr:PIN domain-containing protein [Nanoarchaeota archaeon]MBU2459297.1 PIN domain-containing protein [Nanoarchaeota archaeon]